MDTVGDPSRFHPDDGMTTEDRNLHHKGEIDKFCVVKFKD